jgi:diguanylate cyclase (GGDEF)-like protein/PAS domain S-box-containing protein
MRIIKKFSGATMLALRVVAFYAVFGLMWSMADETLFKAVIGQFMPFEHVLRYKDLVFVLASAAILFFVVRQTLQEQARLKQSLAETEQRWNFALEGAGEGVWDWNLETDEVIRSGQWFKIFGYAEHEVHGTSAGGRALMHPDDLPQAIAELDAYLQGQVPSYSAEYRLRCKDASWKWVHSRGMVVSRAPSGRPLRMIGIHADVTERKRNEEEVYRLAHYDTITGLANRVQFRTRLEQSLEIAQRSGNKLALMYLDLDRFKEINDTLGHHIGDQLLKEVAQRLRHCVRAADTVARLGGDEFTLILGGQTHPEDGARAAQCVLQQMMQPFVIAGEALHVTASIGITVAPDDGTDTDTLLKNADQAMYAAKALGGNQFHFFTASMQEASVRRMQLIADLRTAIAEQQFELHYQPIKELATGLIHKAEALVRWNHPQRGLVSPVEFIQVAEECGLIIDIGQQVFVMAADQALEWRGAAPDFKLSINISPVQIRHRGQRTDWLSHLTSIGLPGEAVIAEITEGVLLDAEDNVQSRLGGLLNAGIRLAIDDFGTGYSSLAYIRKFDISYVKIDRAFTQDIEPGSDNLVLCEAIIVMAHKLGMKVIAEGVETQQQHDLLLAAGCDFGQGYFYSRPVAASIFEKSFLSLPAAAQA